MKNKYILTLSGNDIFSGGGLYADLATYTVHGLHGFLGLTCLTAVTAEGFEIIPTDSQIFAQQLASLETVPFSAIKIGLLPNREIARQVLTFIQSYPSIPIVLDPVMVCKETQDKEVSALREELLRFFPYVTLITPNLSEAQLLLQRELHTLEDVKQAARDLHAMGASGVVIKGGNRLDKEKAIDVYYDGKNLTVLEADLLSTNNVGAGCTFASSIASQLVVQPDPLEAVRRSKDFVYRAIANSDEYGVIHYGK